MFKKMNLSIRPLEVPEQVVVEGVLNCSADLIELHFENEGGEVKHVRLNEVEQSAVVTFKDRQGICLHYVLIADLQRLCQ